MRQAPLVLYCPLECSALTYAGRSLNITPAPCYMLSSLGRMRGVLATKPLFCFLLLSVSSLYEVGQGVCIKRMKLSNETGSQLLDEAISTHTWIRVHLQNTFSQVTMCRVNFIHKICLSRRLLLEGCLLNYRLEDMKEDGNASSCYPFYFHQLSSIPASNPCSSGFPTALRYGPLRSLEC